MITKQGDQKKTTRNVVDDSERRFSKILEQAIMGIAIVRGPEMAVTFANQRIIELWGRDTNMIGRTLLELFPGTQDDPFLRLLAQVYTSGVPYYGYETNAMRIGNGTSGQAYFNFILQPYREPDDTISGVTIFTTDVTESVLSKKKVQENERQFKRVLLESPSIFLILKGYPEMVISFANEPLLKSWGKSSDIVGKSLLDVLPELKDQPFPKLLEQVYRTGKAHYGSEEKAVILRDGKLVDRYYNYVYQPITEDSDTISGVTVMANDITEQVVARKAVEKQNRVLSEQKRILEQIASGRPLADCLDALTHAVSRLYPQVRGCLLTANVERTAIQYAFAADLPRSFCEALQGARIDADSSIGTCGTAIATGKAVACEDIENDELWSPEWRNLCLSEGIRACHSTPVFGSTDKVIASFFLCLPEPRALNEDEQRLAELGAHIASIAIERDRIHADLLESERQLEAELADAKLLQGLSMELIQEENNEALYEKIMDAAVAIMHSDYASMQALDHERGHSGELRLLTFRGFNPEAAKFWQRVSATSESTCGAALRTGKRVVVRDVDECDFMAGTEDLRTYENAGIRAVQTTPLFGRNGQLLGMISTHWRREHHPTDRDLHLLDILARQAADLLERARTAETIRKSEQRFRALTTATSDVTYRMSPDWTEMHQLEGRNFLADTEQSISNWLEKYIHPEDQEQVKKAFTEAIRTRSVFQLEHQVLRADGSTGWTFSRAIPILNREGEIIEWFGAASDVTQRKEAEEHLRIARDESDRRKRLYEAVTGSTPDLIYVFDLNYRFTYANEALLNMWGRSWDDSIGRRLLEVGYEPWHAEMHEREIDQVVATKKPVRGVVSFPHATLGRRQYDYILVPVLNGHGEVESVAGTTRDITELKKAEEALRESEAKFRRFYESNMLPIAFWTTDGQVYECNDAFQKLTGYTQDEIIAGKFNWLKNTRSAYRQLLEQGVIKAIEGQIFVNPYEIELIGKNGDVINVVVGYSMLEGSKEKAVAFLMDITEQKLLMTQLEKRVDERTKELQRSNEDLQQFAHVASHDLKEPVRKIKTFGYRLYDEIVNSSNEKQKLYIEKVLASAERMSAMIDGVLTYSSSNTHEQKIEVLDLNGILLDIQNDLEVIIQQKGAVIRHDTLPAIEGVHVSIYQLFYNLINNSLKFSKVDQSPVITIASPMASEDGVDYARIVVTDNGIGFEPDYSKRIFQTFTRLNPKAKYEGTGLGLALCKKIVERHHGRIEATGENQKGAVFTIMLPVRQTVEGIK